MAGVAACAAERISARSKFRLSAFQLQAPDRFAASGVEVQSGPGIGLDQQFAEIRRERRAGKAESCEKPECMRYT